MKLKYNHIYQGDVSPVEKTKFKSTQHNQGERQRNKSIPFKFWYLWALLKSSHDITSGYLE